MLGVSERRETPALELGVLGCKARSAAQGPSCLGGVRGSRAVHTGRDLAPPSVLPWACQPRIPRVPVLLCDLGKCNSLSEPQQVQRH